MSNTFLTTDQLAERIQYDARTIREQLKDSVLIKHAISLIAYLKNMHYLQIVFFGNIRAFIDS